VRLATSSALLGLLLAALGNAACDRIRPARPDFVLPAIETIDSIYQTSGTAAHVQYSGNVLELRATQDVRQLQRGGSLWARVGPYIYLFTPATRQVLEQFEGIAAVRVITLTPSGAEIARALLLRDALDNTRWRRSANLLGIALRDGTERPVAIEDLVHWGEEHTEFSYNPDFVPEPDARQRRRGGETN
jgi:hypothetical protein